MKGLADVGLFEESRVRSFLELLMRGDVKSRGRWPDRKRRLMLELLSDGESKVKAAKSKDEIRDESHLPGLPSSALGKLSKVNCRSASGREARVIIPHTELCERREPSVANMVKRLSGEVFDSRRVPAERLFETLYRLFSKLSSREQEVLKLRDYVGLHERWTLEALGKRFGTSRQRVSQIEKNALCKLRATLIAGLEEKV